MRESMTVLAPAKINLGLRVFPKRKDGYHDISSIFTTVSLCDRVTVSLYDDSEKNGCCTVECIGEKKIILPEDNTFTKAYKAFCVLTGNDRGVHVTVEKKIPAGGGLGGGSSDSSSFIKSIDALSGTHLGESDLDEVSGKVGSDVFFFTHALASGASGRFAALVEGRGERIFPVRPRDDFSVLLVFPGEVVPTPYAYSLVDERRQDFYDAGDLEQIFYRPVKDWCFRNDFTVPVAAKFPKIGYALDCLKKNGADFTDMSGSGSTVFGIFEDRDKALAVKKRMETAFQAVLV